MIFRHEYVNGVWVDLEQPSVEEVQQVMQELSIGERMGKELVFPTPAPMVIAEEKMVLLVLHFPSPSQSTPEGETKSQELDFIVGKNFILTVRYEVVAPLHHLKKLLEAQQLVEGKTPIKTDTLLEVLFAHLYTSMRNQINHTSSNLTSVEKEMFGGHEQKTVRLISNISREFLHIESLLANQEEALKRFLEALEHARFFGPSFSERILRISGERLQVERIVKTHRAIATELRETNNALLSAKQNEIIKILTVVSFVFLPLALIAKIFAMKMTYMPFADDPYGFWIILGFMFVVALVLTLFVSRKHWIS